MKKQIYSNLIKPVRKPITMLNPDEEAEKTLLISEKIKEKDGFLKPSYIQCTKMPVEKII